LSITIITPKEHQHHNKNDPDTGSPIFQPPISSVVRNSVTLLVQGATKTDVIMNDKMMIVANSNKHHVDGFFVPPFYSTSTSTKPYHSEGDSVSSLEWEDEENEDGQDVTTTTKTAAATPDTDTETDKELMQEGDIKKSINCSCGRRSGSLPAGEVKPSAAAANPIKEESSSLRGRPFPSDERIDRRHRSHSFDCVPQAPLRQDSGHRRLRHAFQPSSSAANPDIDVATADKYCNASSGALSYDPSVDTAPTVPLRVPSHDSFGSFDVSFADDLYASDGEEDDDDDEE
jgi:hypothetical protein